MFNKKLGVLLMIAIIGLTACNGEKIEEKEEVNIPKLTIKEDKTSIENKSTIENVVANKTSIFELTEKEDEAYKNFQQDLNLKHLSELGPISVAKLYIQAGLDKKYNVQYGLYTDREMYIQWTKEEDEKIPESYRPSTEQMITSFKNIDKGTFIETSDFEGYIEYDSDNELNPPSLFQMKKNEDGIWQVPFLPIQ